MGRGLLSAILIVHDLRRPSSLLVSQRKRRRRKQNRKITKQRIPNRRNRRNRQRPRRVMRRRSLLVPLLPKKSNRIHLIRGLIPTEKERRKEKKANTKKLYPKLPRQLIL